MLFCSLGNNFLDSPAAQDSVQAYSIYNSVSSFLSNIYLFLVSGFQTKPQITVTCNKFVAMETSQYLFHVLLPILR